LEKSPKVVCVKETLYNDNNTAQPRDRTGLSGKGQINWRLKVVKIPDLAALDGAFQKPNSVSTELDGQDRMIEENPG